MKMVEAVALFMEILVVECLMFTVYIFDALVFSFIMARNGVDICVMHARFHYDGLNFTRRPIFCFKECSDVKDSEFEEGYYYMIRL